MSSRPAAGRAAFGTLLSRAYRTWRRAADLRLQPYDLTEATWLPLVHIARAPAPPRQKDLAASMSLDGSSVVRLLDPRATGGFGVLLLGRGLAHEPPLRSLAFRMPGRPV